MICFYHSADLDGHCSGAIIKYKYPDCEMIGINYGDVFPWDKVKGQDVVMVDFCLQPFTENMPRLSIEAKSLLWIDHHQSEMEEYKNYNGEFGVFNCVLPKDLNHFNKAACELTWQHIFDEEPPYSVYLLGRYDIWDLKADEKIIPFQWGVRRYTNTRPDNQDFWIALFETSMFNEIVSTGKILIEYRDAENSKYIKAFSFETEFEGLKFIGINRGMTNSQIFDSVWNEAKYDGMLTFCWKHGKWTVSMYTTKNDLDLSSIAKKHGGGGHKQACGFQCTELPFKLS